MPDCGARHFGHGLCCRHYTQRFRGARTRDPEAIRRSRESPEVKARLAVNAAKWRERHPERAKRSSELQRSKYKANPEFRARRLASAQNTKLLKRYGLTLAGRDAILEAQGGACALCRRGTEFGKGGMKAAHVDHCHSTGAVRGVLCGHCNTSLGRLGDSVDSIRKVLEYLERGSK